MIKTSLLPVPSTSGTVALASREDLTESPTRLAALQRSVSKYGVEGDNADKQPVNNPEWSLFNMNESLGVSYQRCHMLAVLLLQQHRPSGDRWVGGASGELEKKIFRRLWKAHCAGSCHRSLAEAGAQSEQSHLPGNYPFSMEIQVQVEQWHEDQPHPDLEPRQHQTGIVEVFPSFQLRMMFSLQLHLWVL